jgi:transcriptional regulator with XRE-family HTH domain
LDPIRSAVEVAREARLSVDALRKIERGEIADPGFFTVIRVCRVLKLSAAEIERAALGRRR